jgi:endonuclease G, mitochondrial
VIERSYKPSYRLVELQVNQRKTRADVMQPGMSIGGVNTRGGSIGTFVRDSRSNKTVLLSNWHVLQGPLGAIGDIILQPGKHDDNRVELNKVGQLCAATSE